MWVDSHTDVLYCEPTVMEDSVYHTSSMCLYGDTVQMMEMQTPRVLTDATWFFIFRMYMDQQTISVGSRFASHLIPGYVCLTGCTDFAEYLVRPLNLVLSSFEICTRCQC